MLDQQTQIDETSATWLGWPLAISPDVERLIGADFQPMLYLAGEGRYIRLSRGAANLLDALDGITSAEQIVARVSQATDGIVAARRRQSVVQTIDGLRRAGVFTLEPPAAVEGARRRRHVLSGTPRLRITRRIDSFVAGPARVAGRHARLTGATLALLATAGLVAAAMELLRYHTPASVFWPAVFVVALVEVTVHELAHAAVCRTFGIRVREAGVMLWGWFLPLAYVDCTDILRLAGRRPRIAVALAGPFVDLVAAGACGAVALCTSGVVAGTAQMLFLSLGLMLARNLMPLLPTDGYHALEAAVGQFNLRRRSWVALRGIAQGRPPTSRREWTLAGYAAVSVLYTLGMLVLVVVEVHALTQLLG